MKNKAQNLKYESFFKWYFENVDFKYFSEFEKKKKSYKEFSILGQREKQRRRFASFMLHLMHYGEISGNVYNFVFE